MVRYELRLAESKVATGTPAFGAWHSPDGRLWVGFYRKGADYLLRFPGLADFDIAADGHSVCCRPVPGVNRDALEHLYNNQVLPLALSRQGRLVLHGSAVETGDGALAFVGRSGRGKSTLAVSFGVNGHPLLTDDRLDVEAGDQDVQAHPSHPSVRLWEDSREALIGPEEPAEPPLPFTPKARLLAGGRLSFCAEPRRLLGMYFLGEGMVDAPVIRPLSGREALISLAQNAFLLDVEARDLVSAHFGRLSRMARLPIFHHLDYPRRFDALGTVRRAVLDHVRGPREAPGARSRPG